MNPLLPSAVCNVFEKEVGAVLHLLGVYIKNFRANAECAIPLSLDEHHFGVPFSRVVIIPADRGNFESLHEQVTKAGEHLHGVKFEFYEGMSIMQITQGGRSR